MASSRLSDDNHNDNVSQSEQLGLEITTLSKITRMESTLFNAAAAGEIDSFKKNGNLAQLLTPNKNTILHIHITAAKSDQDTKFVEEMLKICPSLLLQTNVKGETPLHQAARYGHSLMVELLIKHAKENHQDIERGNEAAKVMLRMKNKENDTALHEAVRFRHLKVVRILTNEDPNFSYSANEAGETPLYMAAEREYRHILREILNNCSSPALDGPNNRTVLHAAALVNSKEMTGAVLKKFGNLTKEADEKGRIPLHYAAARNYLEVVKVLLEHDKNSAYIKDEDGITALHVAALFGNHNVMKEIIAVCLDCCELVDEKGRNVLHFAMESGSDIAIKVILDDYSLSNLINEKDIDGNTPFLQMATSANYHFSLADHPRVDKMAFNKQNKNARDIFYEKVSPYKGVFEKIFKSKYLRSNLRVTDMHTQDAAKELELERNAPVSDRIEKGAQAELVVAALIATVTFAAGFTLPGGYVSDAGPLKGSAILRENTAFRFFMITDTIAMVLSTAAVLTIFVASIQNPSKMLSLFQISLNLTMWSMGAMVLAFVTGTYAVLSHSTALAIATCVVGSSFYIFFFVIFRKGLAIRLPFLNRYI